MKQLAFQSLKSIGKSGLETYVYMLGTEQNLKSIDELYAVISTSKYKSPSLMAIRFLDTIETPALENLSVYISILNTRNQDKQLKAVREIGKMGYPGIKLIIYAQKFGARKVQRKAIEILEANKSDRSLDALLSAMSNSHLRDRAKQAIDKIIADGVLMTKEQQNRYKAKQIQFGLGRYKRRQSNIGRCVCSYTRFSSPPRSCTDPRCRPVR